MGDNEGLASLSQSGEPLVGKDSSLDRDSKKRLSRLAFPLESRETQSPPRWPQTEGVKIGASAGRSSRLRRRISKVRKCERGS